VLRIAGALMDRIADAPARVVDRAHARRLTDMEKERGRIDNDAERADTG